MLAVTLRHLMRLLLPCVLASCLPGERASGADLQVEARLWRSPERGTIVLSAEIKNLTHDDVCLYPFGYVHRDGVDAGTTAYFWFEPPPGEELNWGFTATDNGTTNDGVDVQAISAGETIQPTVFELPQQRFSIDEIRWGVSALMFSCEGLPRSDRDAYRLSNQEPSGIRVFVGQGIGARNVQLKEVR
jgi:hypothetical protein